MSEFVGMRHEFPWIGRGFLHPVHESELSSLRTKLRDLEFELTELDGTAMAAGRPAFFADVQRAFGFPDYFGANWAAFNDSFGDLELPPRLAIVWRSSDEAAQANPALFGEACAEFARVARAVSTESIQIVVVLMGSGASYHRPR